jgi:hypothetical protein
MGRKKTEILSVTNCIAFSIDNNPSLAMKFAEYHLKNWDDMPCFRGGGLNGTDYFQVFFIDAQEKINEFIEKHKKDTYSINTIKNFNEYK